MSHGVNLYHDIGRERGHFRPTDAPVYRSDLAAPEQGKGRLPEPAAAMPVWAALVIYGKAGNGRKPLQPLVSLAKWKFEIARPSV